MQRFGKITELSNLMVFLQTDGCNYITGHTITIDVAHYLAAPSTFASLKKMSETDWYNTRMAINESAEKEKSQRSVG